ncbi:hypothetical protein [Candidatus Rhabdochlamydia porcellionis]|jgi:hypothetical protein|uniref:Uncharacterized protein n=1 Tax=Candidatus Rhabdochlamydia porcellionis TaxID=225148 RepID=A0ABX8YZY9_9BACT|nr:hypothetical protein [Candidatus Rhabdochlamydia porcellionis]QZA58954.1 hypothetical protein RHAB15C_0000837 [Candidatus Rhabdochlamydia porcellionis]
MIISLSEYYYTNRFIPASTDPTILKVVKVSALIFLGFFTFFLDCTRRLLVYRNITQKKDLLHFPSLVKHTLDSTERIRDTTAVVERASTEVYTDQYSVHLGIQRDALEKCLKKDFQVTPENFLKNLKLFVAKEPIDFKFVPIFGEGPLSIQEHLVKVVEKLLKKHSNNELSKDYEEYTYALRDAINTEEYKSNRYVELSFIIQELCLAKFVSTSFTELQEKILRNMLESNLLLNVSNISEQIKKDNEILKKHRIRGVKHSVSLNWEKLRNSIGINSDQLSSANMPERRSIHKIKQDSKDYSIDYIRYPTPTIQLLGSAVIASEFIGFLDYTQKKGISFLHVNHQYMDKESNNPMHFADNNRAEAIQKLEETYAETFHFLSLPFDGLVIDEIDKGSLTDWKKSLVEVLIKEKRGFRLPKKFKKSTARKREEIKQLLNKLHEIYFLGKSKLNKIERRVLLVVFYSYLKEYFKSEYQIRIMASVCKDNKDRGNVSACIDEALFNLRLGKEKDPQALKDLHLRILSPFIFRKEGIVEHRLKFLIDLLNHIATLVDDQKEKIRAFKVNEQYQIVDQWIPRSNEDVRI